MKKLLMSVLFAAGCLAANAEGDWRETCGKIVCLGGDTGLAGFVKRMAPDYMTGDFAEADRPEKKPLSANRNGYYDKDLAWHGGYFNDVVMAKIMNVFSKKENRANPLIGSAGVSAVPMAARAAKTVDWARAVQPAGQRRLELVRKLAKMRHEDPIWSEGAMEWVTDGEANGVIAFTRTLGARKMLVAANLTGKPADGGKDVGNIAAYSYVIRDVK